MGLDFSLQEKAMGRPVLMNVSDRWFISNMTQLFSLQENFNLLTKWNRRKMILWLIFMIRDTSKNYISLCVF